MTAEPASAVASGPRRREALEPRISGEGLDGLLVSYPPNLRYLTGFSGSAGLLLVARDRALLLVDSRYEEQARQETGEDVEVRLAEDGLLGAVAGAVAGLGAGTIGFEAHRTTVRDAGRLREEAPGPDWRETEGLVEAIRARKEEAEIGLLQEAARVACEALGDVLGLLSAGATERELAAELDYRLRRGGDGPPAFEAIVASGPRSALPHARPSERVVREGDLVLFDCGATVGGYCSDVTRTVVAGSARAWQHRMHEAVRAARDAALDALEVGRPATDVDAAARSVLEERSADGPFGHSVGHGIGLEVHEEPSLSRKSDDILHAGNVVTIEPGVYVRGRGGIRLEDDVVVGDTPEVLSDAPRNLLEI